MRKFLISCAILMMSSVVRAQETITETCANGEGTIITGVITGHKYCMSNNPLNWWNAYAWCDALGRRMFKLDDCACSASTNCNYRCADLVGTGSQPVWTATPEITNGNSYRVVLSTGDYSDLHVEHYRRRYYDNVNYALCY